jgi:hypothetical protein
MHALMGTEIETFVTGRDEGVDAVDKDDGVINQRVHGAIMELVAVHVLEGRTRDIAQFVDDV